MPTRGASRVRGTRRDESRSRSPAHATRGASGVGAGRAAVVEIRPFRALRYDPGRVDPDAVIAPPYDVVDEAALQALLERSPYNVARVESAPGTAEERYHEAARTLRRWREAGVLRRDARPSYYAYEQRSRVGGAISTRRGLFARLRLREPGEGEGPGRVLPHEATMEGPRAERLALLEATGAHVSPIFGIFEDDERGSAAGALAEAAAGAPDFEGVDAVGDRHRLWVVRDDGLRAALERVLAASPVTIADGHHRYATALAHRGRRRSAAGAGWSDDDPASFVLAALVPAGDPGLVILPIHRLIRASSLPADLLARLAEHYVVEDMTPKGWDGTAAHRLWGRVRAAAGGPLTFGAIGLEDQRLHVLTARSRRALEATMAPGLSAASRRIDVLALTETVLRPLLGIDQRALAAGDRVAFTEEVEEAWERVASGRFRLAFLVNPTRVGQVLEVAAAGELLPQKSTFFYPKLGTGLVLDPLDA